jgi:hypothetical protein
MNRAALLTLTTLTIATLAPAARAQFPAGLVSYWQFNETSGNVAADSVGANNGTISGDATRISGAVGQGNALNFTNGSGSVNYGNLLSAVSGITIEVLIRPSWNAVPGNYDEIFRKEDGNSRILLSLQNDGNGNGFAFPTPGGAQGPVLSFGLNIGGVYQELDTPLDGLNGRPSLSTLTNGDWYHVVATYDSATGVKRLAINGNFVFAANYAPGSLIASGGSAPALTSVDPYTGGVDELAFYGRALSASEVASHYANVQAGRSLLGGASSAAAPEPGTLSLLGFLSIGLLARRARRGG